MNRKQRSELNKKNIGFVFQSYHLLDNLTVAENLDLPLSYKDIKKSERASMVGDTLDRFNIVGKKDLYPNQLSGGQQQLERGLDRLHPVAEDERPDPCADDHQPLFRLHERTEMTAPQRIATEDGQHGHDCSNQNQHCRVLTKIGAETAVNPVYGRQAENFENKRAAA
jgi:hypothetical protein